MMLDSRPFTIASALVYPDRREIRAAGRVSVMSPKALQVLTVLAQHAPNTVPRSTIMDRVWPQQVVGDEVLFKAISELRSAFSDPARKPQIIATVPRQGYRLMHQPGLSVSRKRTHLYRVATIGLMLAIAAIASSVSTNRAITPHPNIQRAQYVLDHQPDSAGVEQSRLWLREALGDHPADPLAHALMAEVLVASGQHSEAADAADRALGLDSSNVRALLVRGRIALEFEWDLGLCDLVLTRAERLNEDVAMVAVARAAWFAATGDVERSIQSINRALTADPVNPVARGDLAFYYYLAGRPGDVLRQVAAFRQLQGDTPFMQALEIHALMATAQRDPELEALRSGLTATGFDSPETDAIVASNPVDRMQRYAAARLSRMSDYSDRPLAAAGWLVQTGESKLALDLVSHAIKQRSTYVPFLRVDPQFATLRKDPLFWMIYPVKTDLVAAQGDRRLVFR